MAHAGDPTVNPFIHLKKVTLTHGIKQVISQENVEVAENVRILVICGPSGCGKTTLLRALVGLHPPASGHIAVMGQPIRAVSPLRSYLPQSLCLFPWKSVLQNVEFGLLCQGVNARDRRQRATAMLDAVGLERWASSSVSALSGGMKQRVALARALVTEPECVFLDEPFNALDERATDQLCVLLSEIASKTSRFVIVSHDLNAAAHLADHVLVHDAGMGFHSLALRAIEHPRPLDYLYTEAHTCTMQMLRDLGRCPYNATTT